MLNKTRELIEQIRMRLLIRRMRNNLEFFGYDVSHLNDQELLDLVGLAGQKLARAANDAAVSLEQMAEIVTKMATAFRRMEDLDDAQA